MDEVERICMVGLCSKMEICLRNCISELQIKCRHCIRLRVFCWIILHLQVHVVLVVLVVLLLQL